MNGTVPEWVAVDNGGEVIAGPGSCLRVCMETCHMDNSQYEIEAVQ